LKSREKKKKPDKRIYNMKNKSSDIYFFSGTGNTYLAAAKIARTLERGGCGVKLLPIEKSDPSKVDLTKTLGIGFTVACWNTYPLVRKFIKNLPETNGTEAFVFCTMGDNSFKTQAEYAKILKDKGYEIIGTKAFRMPNNFIAIQSEEKNKRKISLAYPKIERFASDLLDGKAETEKTNALSRLCFKISRFITGLWEKQLAQKMINLRVKKDLCVKCGLCQKLCPTQNIVLKDYPEFKGKCQICLRCSSYCPKKAIVSFAVFGGKTYRALNEEVLKNALC
jgi:formate hydrogenlyase subunit 6/NADH:ubiquinone oxidoreductase subunit I